MSRRLRSAITFFISGVIVLQILIVLSSQSIKGSEKRTISPDVEKDTSRISTDAMKRFYKYILLGGNPTVFPEKDILNIQLTDGLMKIYQSAKYSPDLQILLEAIKYYENTTPTFELAELILKISRLTASQNYLKNYAEEKIRIGRSDSVYLHYILAGYHFYRADYQTALTHLSEIKDQKDSIQIVIRKIEILRNQLKLNDALHLLVSLNPSVEYIPEIENLRGTIYYYLGNYSNARSAYLRAERAAEKTGALSIVSKVKINLGILHDIEGNLVEARKSINRGLQLAIELNEAELIALGHSELGVSYSFSNEISSALHHYKNSLKKYEILGDFVRRSILYANIGNLVATTGNYRGSIKYFNTGLELSLDDRNARRQNLLGIADAYLNLGDYSKALKYYKDLQRELIDSSDAELTIKVSVGLGSLYFNIGKYEYALNEYKNAEKIIRESQLGYLLSDIYIRLANVSTNLKDFQSAEKYFKYALNELKNIGDYQSRIQVLSEYGEFLLEKGKVTEAGSIFKELQKSRITETVPRAKYEKLLFQFRFLSSELAYSDLLPAVIKKLKQYADLTHISEEKIEIYHELGKFYTKIGIPQLAEFYLTSAVNLTFENSFSIFSIPKLQIYYNSLHQDVTNSLMYFYIDEKKYEQAFEVLELNRSRNNLQNLSNTIFRKSGLTEEDLEKLYTYEWLKRNQISDTIILSNDVIKQFESFKDNFLLKDSVYRKNSNSEITFISYFIEKDQSISMFIQKEYGMDYIKTGVRYDSIKTDLEHSAVIYDTARTPKYINSDIFSFNLIAANNLFNKLFLPIEKTQYLTKKIVISLPSELQKLSFDFFVTNLSQNHGGYEYQNAKYLVEQYEISYAPSFRIYQLLHSRNKKYSTKTLIIGDPAFNNRSELFAERRGLLDDKISLPRNVPLQQLRYSGEEVNIIQSRFQNCAVYTGISATESNFKNHSENSAIIHISSHSWLIGGQPVIFFSNIFDAENDGSLELNEVADLKLNSNLVVLSSCNSGLGIEDKSEGILGMSKAFFEAGANNVIVTLWEVSDKHTALFMEKFYSYLSEVKNPAKALQLAKISFMKEISPNPFYWAGFVLVGGGNEIDTAYKNDLAPFLYALLLIFIFASVLIIFRKPSITLPTYFR